eukprot:9612856-Ditylum_brightwellii.AAC.1
MQENTSGNDNTMGNTIRIGIIYMNVRSDNQCPEDLSDMVGGSFALQESQKEEILDEHFTKAMMQTITRAVHLQLVKFWQDLTPTGAQQMEVSTKTSAGEIFHHQQQISTKSSVGQ